MKKNYEAPLMEVIELAIEDAVLQASVEGFSNGFTIGSTSSDAFDSDWK